MKNVNIKRITVVALLCFALLSSLVIGGVYAYLKFGPASLTNGFNPDVPETPSINEEVTETVKSNVSVNIGDTGYTAFVRVALVISWKYTDPETGDVSVLPTAPKKDSDYTVALNLEDWFLADDGFYYHKDAVESNTNTDVLINNLTVTKTAPASGYVLSVDIITQTIQALGTTDSDDTPAVEDAWKVVTVESGKLVKKP